MWRRCLEGCRATERSGAGLWSQRVVALWTEGNTCAAGLCSQATHDRRPAPDALAGLFPRAASNLVDHDGRQGRHRAGALQNRLQPCGDVKHEWRLGNRPDVQLVGRHHPLDGDRHRDRHRTGALSVPGAGILQRLSDAADDDARYRAGHGSADPFRHHRDEPVAADHPPAAPLDRAAAGLGRAPCAG